MTDETDSDKEGESSGDDALADERTSQLQTFERSEALPFAAGSRERPPTPVRAPEPPRGRTGTLANEEVEAAMQGISPSGPEAAPWLKPPPPGRPSSAPAGSKPSAWASSASPARPSSPPAPPAPPAISRPPQASPTQPSAGPSEPPAVLSPAMFSAAGKAAQMPAQPGSTTSESGGATAPAGATAPTRPSEHTQLLWYEADAVERVRAHFSDLVDELDFVEPDPKRDLLIEDPTAAKEHHHCLGVLSRGRPGGARSLFEAYAEAGQEGAFVAPVALVEGELRPSFDEVARLERLVALLTPLARSDDKLRTELDEVGKLFDQPVALRIGGTAARIERDLEALFSSKHRGAVEGLADKVDRLLLEDRAFARRPVFGSPHVRATLTCRDDDTPVVVYLPEEVADRLPLFPAFPARLLAEVHPPQDGLEGHPLALLAVALGRLVRPDLPRYGGSPRRR